LLTSGYGQGKPDNGETGALNTFAIVGLFSFKPLSFGSANSGIDRFIC
jgi:hypothetical protein